MPQDRAQRPGSPSQSNSSMDANQSAGSISAARAQQGTYFLGRYRVVDEIGIGGMASVHLARMDGPGGFQKWVAIKRIHPHLVEDDSFIQMFLDEARVAARISHPNVASVFELGKHEDTYWIAMEYLHGEPLREVMRRTEELGAPMPPEIACRVIADAAEGLNAAHELTGKNGEKLNLIHRDVTPHNLFVTYDGTTKVVDFGIAKFTSRMSSTRAGTLKGKLAYMSPEQVQGEQIDRRTDIFALGVVLWELTTGQRLFRMESDLDTLAKVQECNIPRPTSIVRGYPIDLEKIVMKALAKNRGERFKTAREFSRALQSLLMRRGLFIASDEVSTYVQSIFQDRIAKREAHLRWAGDVTQTINVEGMLGTPPAGLGSPIGEPSIRSYSSEVQHPPNAPRPAPRPAAGMPAAPPTQPRGQPQRPPRPGEGRPGQPIDRLATTSGLPSSRNQPGTSAHPADEEQPTMQANVDQPLPGHPNDDFEDDDDNDATIVTTTRGDAGPSPRGAPLPAAGQPAQGFSPGGGPPRPKAPQPYPAPPRPGSLPPGPPQTVRLSAPPPPPPPPPTVPYPSAGVSLPPAQVNPFAQTLSPDSLSDPALPNMRISRDSFNPYPEPPPPPPPAPPPRSGSGVDQSRFVVPTQPRLFVPPDASAQTRTAQAVGRRPPMWVVAVASGFAALIVAGVVFIVLTQVVFAPKKPYATGAPSAAPSVALSAPPPTPTTPAVAGSAGPGPFSVARAGFLTALGPGGPTSMLAPSDAPASAPAGAGATAPTTAVAAATVPTAAPSPSPDPAPAPAPAPPPAVVAVSDPRPVPAPAAAPPAAPPAANTGSQTSSAATSRKGGSEPQAKGTLTVVCIPGCDQITFNGEALGGSPVVNHPVPVGTHKLRLQAGSYVKVESIGIVVDQLRVVRESMSQ